MFMPLAPKFTDTSINSFFGLFRKGTPECHAISASPVASIILLAKIACLPDLLSVITPLMVLSSITTSTAIQWSKGVILAFFTNSSARCLKISVSKTS